MVILVTGGAGFIGSHVVDELVAAGHAVRVLDVLHPVAHSDQPDYLNPHAEYLWGDVADNETAAAAARGIDACSHQAAMVGLGTDFAEVRRYSLANDLGTATLLEELHAQGFDGRLVLASSMVVYGEGAYRCPTHGSMRPGPRDQAALAAGRWDPTCPVCDGTLTPEAVPEDAPLDPRNVYAATKAHQEHLCSAYGREHGSDVVALRYHNVYGPRMPRDTPYAGVASIFRSALAAGRAPAVLEDGGQRRDFVHVRDVAHANVLALTGDTDAAGAFNVASGTPRTVLEMAHALAAALDGPEPEVVGGARLGDVRHVFAATDRAARELGFRAAVNFEAGMREFAHAPLRAAARGSGGKPDDEATS